MKIYNTANKFDSELLIYRKFRIGKIKKHVNPISQSSFFEKVWCLILASSQRKLYGYTEIFKFDITIKKFFFKFKFI